MRDKLIKKGLVLGIITLLVLTTFAPYSISEEQGSGGSFNLNEFMQEVLEEHYELQQSTNETTLTFREYDPEQEYDPDYVDYISGEVVVGLKPCYNVSQMESFLNHSIIDKIEILNMALVQVDQGGEVAFIEELENRSDVYFAERDIVGYACWEPNDPGWESQWAPKNIKCPEAWDIEKGNSSIILAILDGGVDYTHPDLDDNMWINAEEMNGETGKDDDNNGYVDDIRGWNVVNDTNYVLDISGHGTMCAGIAAAEINNAEGIAGVANVTIMPVVMSPTGLELRGRHWVWAKGIIYAAINDAWVISMSYGNSISTVALCAVCRWAYTIKNCLIVAAAGNAGNYPIINSWVFYPSGFPSVISVGASDQEDERYVSSIWSSNYGLGLELMAPGNYTNTTMPTYHVSLNDNINIFTGENWSLNYDYGGGTSGATPHVAGVAALYYSKQLQDDPSYKKNLTNLRICRYKLQKTALDMGWRDGWDIFTGHGLVQADDMLTKNVIYIEIVGNGSVASTPDQATYVYNSVVQLTANASTGWVFDSWSGDLSSATSQENITLNGDKYVIATFTEE